MNIRLRNTFAVSVLVLCACAFPHLVMAQDVPFPPPSPSPVLFWGNEDGSDPTQVRIENGGTYSVSLGKGAPIFFSFTDGVDHTNMSGTLSRIIPPTELDGQETTQFVAFVPPHGSGGARTFTWPEEGTYELSVFSMPVFMEVRGHSMLAWLVGEVAYADILVPPPSRRIRFTIHAAPRCTQECYSNVLFLPGIESSRLYRPGDDGGEDKLWEPNANSDVRDLFLTPEGESIRNDIYTKQGDVLDELPVTGVNVYKTFQSRMESLKSSGTITDWEAVSYDWRLSLDDVLSYGNEIEGRVYYAGEMRATSTPYIVQELRRLAGSSKSGKVTIVAHSNGGLVAKRLTEILGAEASQLIDTMIFVAVPQAGTPMAIPAALHGYEQSHGPFGIVTSEATARAFASTSPMAYHLLPSAQYFTYVDDPVVSFDDSLPQWREQYGETVHSAERLRTFVTGAYGKTESDDVHAPIQLSGELLARAEVLHQTLDTWVPPQGVELIQIAGWGVPKTVSGITYEANEDGVQATAQFTVDGDGTVVVPSALWTSESTGAKNYWVDLAARNRLVERIGNLNLHKINHMDILEVDPVLNFIEDSITEKNSSYPFLSETQPESLTKQLHFSLHSPLTLDLYDEHGNHTGIATSTGMVEENIPGTYFVQFGETKYLFTDTGTPQFIVMSGYDTGTFTFEVGEMQGDTLLQSVVFRDVPTTPQTKARFSITDGISSASDLQIDEDGDGSFETTYASTTGERLVPVFVPPEPVAMGNGMPVATSGIAPSVIPTVAGVSTTTLIEVQSATSTATTTEVATQKASSTPKAKNTAPRVVHKKESVTPQSDTLQASVAVADVPKLGFVERVREFVRKMFQHFKK